MTFDFSLDCGKSARFQKVDVGKKTEGETTQRQEMEEGFLGT